MHNYKKVTVFFGHIMRSEVMENIALTEKDKSRRSRGRSRYMMMDGLRQESGLEKWD